MRVLSYHLVRPTARLSAIDIAYAIAMNENYAVHFKMRA
jgi:hypothetical protein